MSKNYSWICLFPDGKYKIYTPYLDNNKYEKINLKRTLKFENKDVMIWNNQTRMYVILVKIPLLMIIILFFG